MKLLFAGFGSDSTNTLKPIIDYVQTKGHSVSLAPLSKIAEDKWGAPLVERWGNVVLDDIDAIIYGVGGGSVEELRTAKFAKNKGIPSVLISDRLFNNFKDLLTEEELPDYVGVINERNKEILGIDYPQVTNVFVIGSLYYENLKNGKNSKEFYSIFLSPDCGGMSTGITPQSEEQLRVLSKTVDKKLIYVNTHPRLDLERCEPIWEKYGLNQLNVYPTMELLAKSKMVFLHGSNIFLESAILGIPAYDPYRGMPCTIEEFIENPIIPELDLPDNAEGRMESLLVALETQTRKS